jgi:hypothetical protein
MNTFCFTAWPLAGNTTVIRPDLSNGFHRHNHHWWCPKVKPNQHRYPQTFSQPVDKKIRKVAVSPGFLTGYPFILRTATTFRQYSLSVILIKINDQSLWRLFHSQKQEKYCITNETGE